MTNPIKTSITIIIATLCSLLSACGSTEASRVLGEIEDYMYAHPDTRLDDLIDIDSAILSRTADRMLYEVLLTQAIDKAHGSLATRDSVMQVAADWFTGRSDTRHALLANYFLGRVKFEKEDYPESLVAMFKAHDLAKELDDKFWIGMSARGIADVYYNSYNGEEAVTFSKIEYDNLKFTDRQPYINYALYDLATAYSANRDYPECIVTAKQVLDSAYKYNDSFLQAMANQTIGVAYLGLDSIENSKPYITNSYNSPFATREDSIFYSSVTLYSGDIQTANEILNNLSDIPDIKSDRLKALMNFKSGNYKEAFNRLRRVDNLTDGILKKRISSNLSNAVINYHDIIRQKNKLELKNTYLFIWLYLIISILILIIIIFAIIHYKRIYDDKLNHNLIIAQNLRDVLSLKTNEYVEAQTALRELIDNKVKTFNQLCLVIYENNNPHTAKKKISDAVIALIDQFNVDSTKFYVLEDLVNKGYNNIMSDLKTDLPNIKNIDYALFLYSILGFSISSISIFFKEDKISSIYDRKRRLKDNIKKLEPSKSERYLKLL